VGSIQNPLKRNISIMSPHLNTTVEAVVRQVKSPLPVQRLADESQLQEYEATDPFRLAEVFLTDLGYHDGQPVLRLWKNRWWRWQDSHYSEWSATDVKDELRSSIKREFDRLSLRIRSFITHVTAGKVEDTFQALRSLDNVKVADDVQQPAWIDDQEHLPADEFIALKNGLLHVPSYLGDCSKSLWPHTPDYFNVNALDFDFEADAPEPVEWMKFLRSVWGDDQESILLLQEWFGYSLTPTNRHQKILMMVGPPRSGKGTSCRILEDLVGKQNASATSLNDMSSEFRYQILVGKSLAILSDVRLSARADVTRATESLLCISGGDTVAVNCKYAPPVPMKLPVKFVLVTNKLPNFQDATTVHRFLILTFTRSYLGHEDEELGDRLRAELPGILRWALAGLKRLQKQKWFTKPAAGEATREKLQSMNAPVVQFVKDSCQVPEDEAEDPEDYVIGAKALFTKFRVWWLNNVDADPPKTAVKFVQDLHEAVPNLKLAVRRIDGKNTKVYVGIKCDADQ
jgi:putative DNA primase/helicase